MNESDEILVLSPDDPDVEYDFDDTDSDTNDSNSKLWPIFLGVGFLAGLAVAIGAMWYLRPEPYDATSMDRKVASLESQIRAIQNKADPFIPTVDLTPIQSRLSELEARPTVDPLNTEIVSRLEALQAEGFELPEIPEIPDIDGLLTRLAELEKQVARQSEQIAVLTAQPRAAVSPVTEPRVDPKTLPSFPEQVLRDGVAELGGSGFIKRTFSRHVRVRGNDSPDRLIDGIKSDLANGQPRAALAKFDRLPPQLQSLTRGWRADMEDALR